MAPTRDLRTVLGAAETAAAAGDFATAADQLREALAIQEATLGPRHPDLADTLNNLGVASERAQRLDDAEGFYRRALSVAMAAFDANHPFVATSRANLREFCEANGRPFDPPKPVVSAPPKTSPPPKPTVETRPAPVRETRPEPKPAPVPPPPPAAKNSMGPVIIGMVVIAAVIGFLVFLRSGSDGTTAPEAPVAVAAPPAPVAPPPAAPERTPARSGGASAASAGAPSVVNPRLCRSLDTDDDWNCDRATSPVRGGALIFLTRVKSDRNTTVQHRWYRGQELVRSAQLRIVANPGEGYRTYSRFYVTPGADWRVELRSADGALIHEEKFVVK
jgi:hypothetical protein